MDKNADLLNKRLELYRELLECTTEQKRVAADYESMGKREEEILPFFAEYFETWDKHTQEIEWIERELGSLDNSEADYMQIQEMMLQITSNINDIQVSLEAATKDTRKDLRGVRNQQKVMNAYYHLDSKDNVALYFDEKK